MAGWPLANAPPPPKTGLARFDPNAGGSTGFAPNASGSVAGAPKMLVDG